MKTETTSVLYLTREDLDPIKVGKFIDMIERTDFKYDAFKAIRKNGVVIFEDNGNYKVLKTRY